MKEYTLKTFSSAEKFQIDYQSELNQEQLKVVVGGDGPCLVLAGAGSGKTRTLVYRVAYLLEKGVKPNRILLVTFTNKAAREMLGRIESLLHSEAHGLWGGTFHHLGNRILRIYGPAIGINPNFNILDSEDSRVLVKACFSGVQIPQDKYFPKADLIHKTISLAANLDQPLGEVLRQRFSHLSDSYFSSIEAIAKMYDQKKRAANALDFDDLLLKWKQLLIESQAVREKLTAQFQYVLVDEYQDTNSIQGEIVTSLAGQKGNILVVGDDSQSIYSFRGADVNNILSFPKVFPACQTFKLETNYRSTPEILALSNESIKNNHKQFKKNLRTHKSSGSKPALVPLEDNYLQAEFVCQRILDLEREEGMGLENIAVLFRAHYQSLELEMELNKRGIPYIMRGGLRFFEQAHIKDITAHLKILANFKDELSWQRLLQLQTGIGAANSQKIWQKVSTLGSLDDVKNYPWPEELSGRPYAGWQKAQSVLDKLIKIGQQNVSQLIEAVIDSGYKDYLENSFENAEERLADLEQLILFAASYDSLEKLLADVALSEGFKGDRNIGTREQPEEVVTLSTIHQAKGLEWKAVFIVGLVDGQFPNQRISASCEDIEEERRLFYVAATRAQDQLYLTYPMFGSEAGVINQPSQFVRELPKNVYEDWRVKEDIDEEEVIYVDEDEEEDVGANFWKRVRARVDGQGKK
ncbi:MAG: ATP-dependent helicase [Patescibacteria group bacterium]